MARPGFVLDTDDRTPPLVVPDGDGFRRERLPVGTKVVYPAESRPRLVDLDRAVDAALDAPLGAVPLAEQLRPGMKLTIAFDDITTPVPVLRAPDLRSTIVEAALTRAARAGVDDVAIVSANGLHRRMTAAELQHLLGERVYRSFAPDGLSQHDAEDTAQLTPLGGAGVAVSSRLVESDLVVFVHLVAGPDHGGAAALAAGLGSTATIRALSAAGDPVSMSAIVDQVLAACRVFLVEAVLDQEVYAPGLAFLARREWEWGVRERLAGTALQQGLATLPGRLRRRVAARAEAGYAATLVTAGDPVAVAAASRQQVLASQVVEVAAPADIGLLGVSSQTPYSVDSVTNPVLAAWSGLAATFGAHTGRPFVRSGGALILYHPLTRAFTPLHHPSYVDFFDTVLSRTLDPAEMQPDEDRFATDPWYSHLYRTSYAFHGVHPFLLWRQVARAREHCAEIVWVGADRDSAHRMGFRAASTLADALEIVAATVGPAPTLAYLHTPPAVVVDLP